MSKQTHKYLLRMPKQNYEKLIAISNEKEQSVNTLLLFAIELLLQKENDNEKSI